MTEKIEFKAPTNEEFQAMTPEQQSKVLNDAMAAVQDTYKEEPLQTPDMLLTKLQSAIESKGFNFYPHALCKAIDAEAERQFQEMVKDIIKGVPPLRLNEIKNTIIKWYSEEEIRFDTYKSNFMEFARPPVLADIRPAFVHQEDASSSESTPVSEVDADKVTPITSAKKKPATKKKK